MTQFQSSRFTNTSINTRKLIKNQDLHPLEHAMLAEKFENLILTKNMSN